MMSKPIIWVIAFFSLICLSFSSIQITQPAHTSFENNTLKFWFTNFGVIHYNRASEYDLYFTKSSLCGDRLQSKISHFKKPTYMVVEEGDCSFPLKALKAQMFGAQGILISSSDMDYAINGVVLSDDGNGRKVKIATLVISPTDKAKLLSLHNPKIKTYFSQAKAQKSSVTLFLSSASRKSYIFLRDFKPYFLKLHQDIDLDIVFHSVECSSCDEKQCILQNKCCSFDQENFKSGKGRYIVEEQFRAYRLFAHLKSKKQLQKWFEYMNMFDDNCDYDWVNSAQCSLKMMKKLEIKNSDLRNVDEWERISSWRSIQTKTGVFNYPELSTNGLRHSESLTPQTSFSMICESLTKPPLECFNNVSEPSYTSHRYSFIILTILALIVFIYLVSFCYRKFIRRQITNDMSSRVNELVSKYASKVTEQKKKQKQRLMEKLTEEI